MDMREHLNRNHVDWSGLEKRYHQYYATTPHLFGEVKRGSVGTTRLVMDHYKNDWGGKHIVYGHTESNWGIGIYFEDKVRYSHTREIETEDIFLPPKDLVCFLIGEEQKYRFIQLWSNEEEVDPFESPYLANNDRRKKDYLKTIF